MSSPAVVVDDVSKTFRLYHERNNSLKIAIMRGRRAQFEEFWALQSVSFEVPEGTTFGLIGENGSGKSTLLKCLARILTPDHGTVKTFGKVSALLELGAGFHPELSGRDNVYLNGSILGLSRKEVGRRFDDIVEFAGLEKFIDTPVKNYSSGMYVRLGFSVAINVDPDVLMVDEVLAVGDEQFQRRCSEKFADLRAAGKTIVIVSHSMGSVRNLCDNVAWLENGKVKKLGSAGSVIDEYVGEAHTGRVQEKDPTGVGQRWGSGEARIEKIEMIGASGEVTTMGRTGDAVVLRLHYRCSEPIARPVFGLAVHTIEGIHVTGPNSREAKVVPEKIDGSGTVEVRIDRLLLLPGTYDLSVSIFDYECLHCYDFWQHGHRIDIELGQPHESFGGVVSLDPRWQVNQGDDG